MQVALVCSSGGAISRNSTAFTMIPTAVSGRSRSRGVFKT